MSLDTTLWIVIILTEAAVVALLLYRRVWKMLPVFCAYSAWALLSDVGAYTIHHFAPGSYWTAYLIQLAVDSALEFGVLIELSWSVLRPLRPSLSRSAPVVVGALVLAVGAAIWPFVSVPGLAGAVPRVRLLVELQQTTSILRVLFFLVLAGFSQLLSIGWRDRELQIATGLGFFSVVSLAVQMALTHLAFGPQSNRFNRFVVASYLCSLLYWVFSFAQKEAERREFTPQMQTFLLGVAGVAHANRVALSDSSVSEAQRRRKP